MTDSTKKFKVYHTRNWGLNSKLHFYDADDKESNLKLCPEFVNGYVPVKENYKHVATVHCLDVEQAFYFTNHIDKAWFDHLNVNVVEESRSTSVGDLVEDEDGQLWFCAGCGWEKVEWSTAPATHMVKSDHFGEYLVPVSLDEATVIG